MRKDASPARMMSFKELQALVRIATGSQASSFYRELYGLSPDAPAVELATQEEWNALPLFTKEHLVRATLYGRTFPPFSNIDTILASSGTSGKGVVFSPWSQNDGYRYRLRYHDFPRASLSSMPVAPLMEYIHKQYAPESALIVLDPDPRRCRASVKLAKAAGVESIFTLTPHVPVVAPEMEREGIANDIRFVEIAGEKCSKALYEFLHRTFPNASIFSIYGSSDVETNPIGIPCRPIDGTEPLEVYHTRDCFYLELIDPATGALLPIKKGIEGDLLITTYAGPQAVFPLIRYRIGDTVRVVEEKCAEHGEWSFEVVGRTEMDFVKVVGGMLRADEIERVLRMFPEKVTDVFELQCTMKNTGAEPKLEPTLYVESVRDVDLPELATMLAREIRIGPGMSYADGVAAGRFLPLNCEKMPEKSEVKKRKRIIWR